MKWATSPPVKGDIVRVKLGALYHYGIFVSENEIIQFGLPPTPQNFKVGNFNVCATDISKFSVGEAVEKAVFSTEECAHKYSPDKTVEIARSHLGEGGYNILHNNCEHFVYLCAFGVKRSLQEEEARNRWRNRHNFDV